MTLLESEPNHILNFFNFLISMRYIDELRAECGRLKAALKESAMSRAACAASSSFASMLPVDPRTLPGSLQTRPS